MMCDLVANALSYTVSSLIYITLFQLIKTILRSETREKIICIHCRKYKFDIRVLTSFSYLFRSEWKWILYFPTIYVYCIYRGMSKAPKKLSNDLKRTETSVDLIVFDCVLWEVSAYKLIRITGVTVSYRRSTWIRYQKTIS
jgi:hypothetical protein